MDESLTTYLNSQSEEFNRRVNSLGDRKNSYPAHSILNSPISQVKDPSQIDNYYGVAGRVISKRVMGNASFVHIYDDGKEMQLFLNVHNVPDYKNLMKSMDLGDIISVRGKVFETRTKEITLSVDSFELLAKSLHPFPDKQKGITDQYTREKLRHLDLIVNEGTREAMLTRSKVNQSIREYLLEDSFIEVETPILQPIYGGANARPFKTTFHAQGNADAYLRISNELYLKRIVTGGINRVFEFAKDFRNEGIDRTHNPEFTQLELYQAYADYFTMMGHVENIFRKIADDMGKSSYEFLGHTIDVTKWKRISMLDSLKNIGLVDIDVTDKDAVIDYAKKFDDSVTNYGTGILAIFEEKVEPELIQPTIVYDYPIEVSPLAKNHRSLDGFVERFEFFIGGKEFGNAYSELNDPLEQRLRFMDQQKLKEVDDEAHPLDEDFLRVMEDGMPPMGGLGIGTDRLAMLFSEKNTIRDVLFFPFKKQ